MATTFYFRSAQIGIATYGNGAALLTRGASATSIQTSTVAGGTWVNVEYFCTRPLKAFTFSGTITCNLRGLESNNLANASLGVRFYKWTKSGGLSALLIQASSATELGTTQGAVTATATAPGTAFADGDVLVAHVGLVAAGGSMTTLRSATFFYNGPTAAASGDSYFTITPNVEVRQRAILTE